MRTLLAAGALIFVLMIGMGCSGTPETTENAPAAGEIVLESTPPAEEEIDLEITPELLAVISYRMGYSFGLTWAQQELEPDTEQLMRGLADGVAGNERQFPKAEMTAAYSEFMRKVRARRKTWGPRNLEAGERFLAENGRREGVVTLPSGLQYEVLTEGEGPRPELDDRVTVHYRAYRIDGREFESSYWDGEPSTFGLSGTVAGWQEGVQLMPVGSRYKLYIPSSLAYGEAGYKGFIQSNHTLVYEIELLAFEEQPTAEQGSG